MARPQTTTIQPALADVLLRAPDDARRTALIGADERLNYDQLGERVRERAAELDLPPRTLVSLGGDRSIEFVVTYLALLDAGHVPILAGDHVDRLTDSWRVGATVDARHDGLVADLTGAPPVDLHPELALLMSTSGSTGCPKLVRLSHRNLVSNALAIGEALALTEDDRGITTLPLHYCYGLSVLHSHLATGAAVVTSEASVVDPCFRAAIDQHGVTNVAGVPHTFELLERSDPESIRTPSLRLLTQAGGRLDPAAVTRWSQRATSWGADFVVMYGQTEATARIAYLPPELVDRRPGTVGRPIPGGSIALRPVEGSTDGIGEIVYRGPNVMMGYATEGTDLALGHTIHELRTGDLGRFHPDDEVFEIVGRRARFVKPFGLRIDLDQVEAALSDASFVDEVAVAGDDEFVVAFAPNADAARVRELIVATTGLPAGCAIAVDAPIPRARSGKVDGGAVLAAARESAASRDAAGREDTDSAPDGPSIGAAGVFATVLGRDDVRPDDTFVTLGGDSLSYVECSIRLERELGRLPHDWHLLPVSALDAVVGPPRRLARLDTTVVLRALGICLVVATHMRLRYVPGGAHMLLAVVGFNLARFMAPLDDTVERVRAGLRTAARAAIPTVIWVGVGMLVFGAYSLGTLLLVNNYVGPASHDGDHWHFWFIEVFVHLVLISTALLAIPAGHRTERRWPYLAPLLVLAGTLVLRMEWAQMDDWYNMRYRTHTVVWFFVLGWLIQRSETLRQRVLTTLVCLAVVPGFFQEVARDWRITLMLVALVWVREVPVPRWLVPPIGVLAAASMWIYVSHFSIWPPLRTVFDREVAYVLTIAAGVAVWFVAERLFAALHRWWRDRPRRTLRPPTTFPSLIKGPA